METSEEGYVIVNPKPTVYINPVEHVLKDKIHGMSLKQLKQITGLSKKSINYHVYNSMNIENTNPFLHGSNKQKIRVFNYTQISKNYFKRNEKRNKIVTENDVN